VQFEIVPQGHIFKLKCQQIEQIVFSTGTDAH